MGAQKQKKKIWGINPSAPKDLIMPKPVATPSVLVAPVESKGDLKMAGAALLLMFLLGVAACGIVVGWRDK